MSAPPPMMFIYDGEAMVPKVPRLADKHFVVGEQYPLAVQEERSRASHNHFFASVQEAFDNLPEDIAGDFASPDHLRRWALIKAGFRDERSIVADSKAEAIRLSAFIKPMDPFAVVMVRDSVVTVYTAKSQSARAMPKGEFAKSKEAVLAVISKLIGTDVTELSDNAGKAA